MNTVSFFLCLGTKNSKNNLNFEFIESNGVLINSIGVSGILIILLLLKTKRFLALLIEGYTILSNKLQSLIICFVALLLSNTVFGPYSHI